MVQFDLFDDTHNRILTSDTYDKFKDHLSSYDCRLCPLSRSRKRIVIDRGNPGSRIMVISERPGENEDRMGVAFVGRAGELLDKIMASIDLDTNRDMLIVNVVKCIPPVDRSPLSDEVRACRPFLDRQIKLVGPRVVILLGAVALKHFCDTKGDFKMEEEAGRFFTISEYPCIQFMVLYHPAFLLRDPRKKKDMWGHVKRLRNYLREEGIYQEAQPAAAAAPVFS